MFSLLPLVAFVSTAIARPPSAGVLAPLAQQFGQQLPVALVPVPDNSTRVPVTLFVMSRCPDALLCESVFDGALQNTWDIVDINLSFVGQLNSSNPQYGVECMHGAQECAGNIQELCAINRSTKQQDWWMYLQCLNYEGKDKVGDQALAQRCAGVSNIPWDDEENNGSVTRKGLKGCVEGDEGKNLLKESVKQTNKAGVKTSCTIYISGKQRCVRDGTWKDCETGHTADEIAGYIKDEYSKLTSSTSKVNEA